MTQTVFLVDDDAAVRDGLTQLLMAHDMVVRAYANAEDFLEACRPRDAGCIVLDLQLPGMNGTALQSELAERGIDLPIIFLTGYGDVATSVHALKSGAVDFLEKPPSSQVLIERVRTALALNAERRREQAGRRRAQSRFAALTPREREVMAHAVAGHPNKKIARMLDISHRTVELHRARVMHKMGAATLVDLIELARACGLQTGEQAAGPEPESVQPKPR
jgi:FixJ family two-component response regulator